MTASWDAAVWWTDQLKDVESSKKEEFKERLYCELEVRLMAGERQVYLEADHGPKRLLAEIADDLMIPAEAFPSPVRVTVYGDRVTMAQGYGVSPTLLVRES